MEHEPFEGSGEVMDADSPFNYENNSKHPKTPGKPPNAQEEFEPKVGDNVYRQLFGAGSTVDLAVCVVLLESRGSDNWLEAHTPRAPSPRTQPTRQNSNLICSTTTQPSP